MTKETIKKSHGKRIVVIILCGVLLATGIVSVLYFVGRSRCVFIAPTGQCYTQDVIDYDAQRTKACEEKYIREHPDVTGTDWKMGCVIAR